MKQRLTEWRSGFAAAAIMVITTFFVQVSGFSDPKSREAFAATMLNRNHFLFSDSEGDDRKV